jgi:hypothetical protein
MMGLLMVIHPIIKNSYNGPIIPLGGCPHTLVVNGIYINYDIMDI